MTTAYEPPLRWLTPPQQVRSQERLARLLDAAEQVITERGFEQAGVAEIMARAGSSVGLFYQRFKSKDDLLRCLLDRLASESQATTEDVFSDARWEGKSARELIEAVVPFLVEVYRHRRGLIRALLVRSSTDPAFVRAAHVPEQRIAERLSRLLLARRGELDHAHPEAAVSLAYQMLRSTLNVLALFELEGRAGRSLDDPRLSVELVEAFCRLVGVDALRGAAERARKSSKRPVRGARRTPATRRRRSPAKARLS